MENKKEKFSFKRIFNWRNLAILIGSLIAGVAILLIYVLIKQKWDLLNFTDGTFVASAILIAFGFMHIVLNMGTFDVIAVGFSNLFSVMKKDGSKKYDGIYGYQEAKEPKRKGTRFYFIPIVTAGFIFLIIAIILFTQIKPVPAGL